MSEPQPTLRLTSPGQAADPAARQPIPSEPSVAQGELTKVIAELQARLATLEKQRVTTGRGRKKTAASETVASSVAPTTKDSGARLGEVSPQFAVAALDARLKDLKELEASLLVEKLALHTRLRAAEQEDTLLRSETHTLHLKMRTFKAMSLRLREQEAELTRAAAELRQRQEAFDRDKQVLEQGRQEIEQIRTQLEREREQVKAIPDVPSALDLAPRAGATTSIHAAAAEPTTALVHVKNEPAPPPFRVLLDRLSQVFSLTALGLAGLAAVSIAIAWLTVTPVYRATAIVAPAGHDIDSASPAGHFTTPVIAESIHLLAQRGLRPFDTPEAMVTSLQEHMTVATGPNRALALSYESTDRDMAVFVLEALSRSYARIHAAAGTRITQAAAADLSPYRDDRPRRAVTWFIVLALTGVAIAALYITLRPRLQMWLRRNEPQMNTDGHR